MLDFELHSEFPVRARRLFDLLRAPAFQEALALRSGALEVSAETSEPVGNEICMRLERTDPALDLSGLPVEGKTERSAVLLDWNLRELSARWSRRPLERTSPVRLEGELVVHPKGEEACRLVERGSVDVRIPLLGRSIERRLVERLETRQPSQADFILSQLGLQE